MARVRHMRDFTAGHISSEDGRELIHALQKELGGKEVGGGVLEFHAGVQYRNILVWRGPPAESPSPLEGTRTQAPHDIPDKRVADYLPQGPGAAMLQQLMITSQMVLGPHPVNQRRIAEGKKPATQVWLWGQGKAPRLESFRETYGRDGAIISAVDLVRGVGILVGWHRIDVPGATGYLDTNYANKGSARSSAAFSIWCAFVKTSTRRPREGREGGIERSMNTSSAFLILGRDTGDYCMLVSRTTAQRAPAHAHGPVAQACGTGLRRPSAESMMSDRRGSEACFSNLLDPQPVVILEPVISQTHAPVRF